MPRWSCFPPSRHWLRPCWWPCCLRACSAAAAPRAGGRPPTSCAGRRRTYSGPSSWQRPGHSRLRVARARWPRRCSWRRSARGRCSSAVSSATKAGRGSRAAASSPRCGSSRTRWTRPMARARQCSRSTKWGRTPRNWWGRPWCCAGTETPVAIPRGSRYRRLYCFGLSSTAHRRSGSVFRRALRVARRSSWPGWRGVGAGGRNCFMIAPPLPAAS
jgi:hypothetical protein